MKKFIAGMFLAGQIALAAHFGWAAALWFASGIVTAAVCILTAVYDD